MLDKVILVLLTIGYVKALNDCHLYNAVWDPIYKLCRCRPGRKGDPNICCYNPDNVRACHVLGDPVLTSFHNSKIPLDYPCGTKVSCHTTKQCSVDVYVSNIPMKSGVNYYTKKVTVVFKKNGKSSEMTFYEGRLKIRNSHPRSTTFTNIPKSEHFPLPFDNQKAKVVWWEKSNLIQVTGCGSKVNIRLAEDVKDIQTRIPGVCILTSIVSVVDKKCPCGLGKDPEQKKDLLEAVVLPMLEWKKGGIRERTTVDFMIPRCDAFRDVLKDCKPEDRRKALKKCAFLISHAVIKTCFSLFSKPEGKPFKNFNTFEECVKVYCTGTVKACKDLKDRIDVQKCAPSLTKCHTWDPYQRKNPGGK